MRLERRIFQLQQILQDYSQQSESFPLFLKGWFRLNKGCGSRDRRELAALSYAYFRLGLLFHDLSLEERVYRAIFLFPDMLEKYLDECIEKELINSNLFQYRNENLDKRWEELLAVESKSNKAYFPESGRISPQINKEAFLRSHLQAPRVWFRAKRSQTKEVEKKFKQKSLEYILENNSFGLSQGTDLESVLGSNRHHFGEVQDLSSSLSLAGLNLKGEELVWDTCAASGGKSLALLDEFPGIKIVCSDVRSSILFNLEKRFKLSGLGIPQKAVLDLSSSYTWPFTFNENSCDVLLCDVPCTGSGTWSRNPERLLQFQIAELDKLIPLQEEIVKNAAPQLKPGGILVYITCSVFSDENEGHQKSIEAMGFQLESMEYMEGADKQADTMFRAIYRKSE